MALFNKDEDEAEGEVRLRHPEGEEDKEEKKDDGNSRGSQLRKQAEEKLGSSSGSSSSSSSSAGGQLPGMGSTSSTSTSSSIDMDDLHSQNEEIISLLQDIKSELDGGGSSSNELL